MKISVIIPVYNVEKYLEQCLDSILEQNFKDYEVIAINDGSTDKSYNILLEYKEKYDNLIIINNKSKGVGAARNYGVELAKGEYILFLDSDDYVEKNLLDTVYPVAKNNDCDLVAWGYNFVDECGNYVGQASLKNINTKKDLIIKDWPVVWNKLFRKSIIQKSGINFPENLWHQDLATIPFYIMKCNKFISIDKRLINYRIMRKGNITHSFNKKSYDMFKILDILDERCEEYLKYNKEIKFLILYHGKASIRKWNKIGHDKDEVKKITGEMKEYLKLKRVNNVENYIQYILIILNKFPDRIMRIALKIKNLYIKRIVN